MSELVSCGSFEKSCELSAHFNDSIHWNSSGANCPSLVTNAFKSFSSKQHRKGSCIMAEREPKEEFRHGSFTQYYRFRSEDHRPEILEECLRTLMGHFGNHITMLDIGCNTGNLTEAVLTKIRSMTADSARNCRMLGVDIDTDLVRRATDEYRSVEGLKFIQANIYNVSMGNDNSISNYMRETGVEQFDIVFCFSSLMYVHLNYGDYGLQEVLQYLCARANVLVVELHSWPKYRDHVKKMRKRDGAYPKYDRLNWRGSNGKLEEYIYEYIKTLGFTITSVSSEKNEFKRDIVVFSKQISG
ncbi:probable RNA methyltransferase CG11342 [Malaya genurostris]|uniref:probable RNA methyltransferase CG11342 n=1 Tax=Malaya genurostris TaxID=325434 RepID=UPI0026F401F1|nr:probable RNA methyltransferase CG11342 [Malaya genurostris]